MLSYASHVFWSSLVMVCTPPSSMFFQKNTMWWCLFLCLCLFWDKLFMHPHPIPCSYKERKRNTIWTRTHQYETVFDRKSREKQSWHVLPACCNKEEVVPASHYHCAPCIDYTLVLSKPGASRVLLLGGFGKSRRDV